MNWLSKQGFDVIPYSEVDLDNLEETVNWFSEQVAGYDFLPTGLFSFMMTFNTGKHGTTAKFPRDSIAFKWRDEIKETKLLQVEWSASRTGASIPSPY